MSTATHGKQMEEARDERAKAETDRSEPPVAELSSKDAAEGVSVVVPSYNHARYVAETLRSIFRQSMRPRELIVIDDGSSDDSPRVIERALDECSFACELIARDNRGLCATLNEGLERARGRYFAYLGSDDLWLPDFLAARVHALDARPRAVLGYGHAYLIDDAGRVVDSTAEWADYADGDARAMLLRTTAPMSPTVVYRRDALLACDGWREGARLEDFDLYLRLAAAGEFAFDASVLSAWRRHARNTSLDQRMMLEEHQAALRRHAAALGLKDEEMERHLARVAFARAEDFLRLGDRRGALALALSNARGATPRTLARTLIRMLMPSALIRRRASVRAARASARASHTKL